MKTVYCIQELNEQMADVEDVLLHIRRLLDGASDIFLVLGTIQECSGCFSFKNDPALQLLRLEQVLMSYFSHFDYMTCRTFEMLMEKISAEPDYFHDLTKKHFYGSPPVSYWDLCRLYGERPSDSRLFAALISAAWERKKTFISSPEAVLDGPALTFCDEEFYGEAMCMRDKLYFRSLTGSPSMLMECLDDRLSLFDSHHILPDERREEEYVMDKIVNLSGMMHFSRSSYCDAVAALVTDGDNEKARRYIKEGLAGEFPDSLKDRQAKAVLMYYDVLTEEDAVLAREKASEALSFRRHAFPNNGSEVLTDEYIFLMAKAYKDAGDLKGSLDIIWPLLSRILEFIPDFSGLLDEFPSYEIPLKTLLLVRGIYEGQGKAKMAWLAGRDARMVYEYLMYCREKLGYMIFPSVTDEEYSLMYPDKE